MGAAESTTVPVLRPGPLMETSGPPVDTLNPVARAVSAQARSADTTTVGRPGAFHHAEAPALAALMVVAGPGAAADRAAAATDSHHQVWGGHSCPPQLVLILMWMLNLSSRRRAWRTSGSDVRVYRKYRSRMKTANEKE